MHRPIGVTILAILAGVAGLYEIWRTAFFLGLVKVTVIGQDVTFSNPQWGQALWALLIAAIWFWVAKGLFEMRAYAWSFGIYISLFTMIFSFFAIIGTSTFEQEFPVMFIGVVIFMYLNYPGVRDQFMKHEMSLLTPEQRAAVEKAQAANVAAAQAMSSGTPPAPPAPPAA